MRQDKVKRESSRGCEANGSGEGEEEEEEGKGVKKAP